MSGGDALLRISLILALINGVLLQRPSRQSNGGFVRFEENSSCTTVSNETGVCLVLRECRSLVPLLKQRRSDYLRKAICGYDGLEPKVCCPPTTPDLTPSTTTTTTTTTTTPVPGRGGFFPKEETVSGNQYQETCGLSEFSHGRVVGGIEAERGAWPWLAALGYRKGGGNETSFKCGGALISPRHVVTAGHCVFQRKDLSFVRLGEHDLQSDDDGAHPIDITIAEKILHPGYNRLTYENDIAILRLIRPVEFTNEIHPICLPDAPELRSMTFTRSFPFVAGWGAVQFRGASSSVLREVQLPVVDPAKCKKAFSNFRQVVVDDKVMCAGFARGGKDACQGDSGGPLMWPKGKNFYLIGVVSFGYKCAEPGYPGIYSRVTYFLDWIKSVTGA